MLTMKSIGSRGYSISVQELQFSSKMCMPLGRVRQRVAPPLEARTAAIRLGIDSTRHQSISRVTLRYSSPSMVAISSTFSGVSWFWTASLRFFHKFSMGLTSGLCAGHYRFASDRFSRHVFAHYYGGVALHPP